MLHAIATVTDESGFGINDDRSLARPDLGLFLVADGGGPTYGGHYEPVGLAAGIEALVASLARPEPEDRLVAAFSEANRVMHSMTDAVTASAKLAIDGAPGGAFAHQAGSVTALLFEGNEVAVCQVGGCRAYRWRGDELTRLLPDHTLGTQLAAEGRGDEHPHHRFVCTRMLGMEPEVQVDHVRQSVAPGDVYLLCTDGLWGALSDHEMGALLGSSDPDAAVAALLGAVGSELSDDTTVVGIAV